MEGNQQGNIDQGSTDQGASSQSAPQGFDYDKLASILDGRQKATEESVLKGYFKEQGLSQEEMAQAIESFKAQRQSKEPDVSGMQASIEKLQSDIAAAQQAATRAKVENVVIIEAMKLGIDPKATPYLTRMADLSDVGDGKGNISSEKVAQALGKVLDDLPALKPTAAQQAGFRVGGEGGKAEPAPTDNAKLKAAFGIK